MKGFCCLEFSEQLINEITSHFLAKKLHFLRIDRIRASSDDYFIFHGHHYTQTFINEFTGHFSQKLLACGLTS